MKKDNLEQFITNNRDAFDDATPNLKVWANIDKALEGNQPNKKKKAIWWRASRVAAAAFVLIVAGTALGYFIAQPQGQTDMASQFSEEFQDTRAFYERQLQDKTVRLASYQHNDLSVKQDLDQFDEVMKELRLELEEAPKGSEEMIINAMIQNYQAKLYVLDRVFQQLNSSKKSTKNNDNGTISL